ncbi:hypothetical protein [Corynebacterium alimapuense]|uniref:Uncharacterized protein n=1 Tax=Corynebacterium alimapuense TaxID=1576874 RepID=A0A3M8K7F5_9CORY|nr:hypothetical protein [Corynebacterium alimapuense]RNE48444.1 hypothetical protein C5L39_08020 [Corynebacterium alimapuense]
MNTTSPARIAHHLRNTRAVELADVRSIMHHPRSLARPVPQWRPPSKHLPGIFGTSPLTVALTRHRVGDQVRAQVRDFGQQRQPAYLVTLRITATSGGALDPTVSEGWVRALLDNDLVTAVHEVATGHAPTFVWLVDGHYQPVPSPASLFSGFSAAA